MRHLRILDLLILHRRGLILLTGKHKPGDEVQIRIRRRESTTFVDYEQTPWWKMLGNLHVHDPTHRMGKLFHSRSYGVDVRRRDNVSLKTNLKIRFYLV
jgi:hypothetical protein